MYSSQVFCISIMYTEYESKINYHSDISASFRGHLIPAVYKRKAREIL